MNETKTEPTKIKTPTAGKPAELAKKTDAPPTPPEPPKPVAESAPASESKPTLKDFDAFLKAAPKEWLPTLMVRIANKCMAEKVFASPGAMAEAIVGASKK